MKIERCRGTYDLLPDNMEKFRYIVEVFRACCIEKGYREIKSPTLEYLYLFSSTGTLTPAKLQKVYSFLDWNGWSGERVVLRPDCTIPAARLYVENIKELGNVRLYYIQNVFSFEESEEISRERWQFGLEVMGSSSRGTDVELILLARELLLKLGIETEIRLSHIGVVKALIDMIETNEEKRIELLDEVLDGNEAILPDLIANSKDYQKALPVINTIGESTGYLKNLQAFFVNAPERLINALNTFNGLCYLLEKIGCKFKINLKAVKGFEYYTDIIFQLFHNDVKLGGGGRYDDLIPQIGNVNVPASGFAIYLDRVMALSGIKGEYADRPRVCVYCLPGGDEVNTECFAIAEEFRKAGCIAEIAFEQGQMKAEWTLVIDDKKSVYNLIHSKTGKIYKVRSIKKALEAMGRI